MQSAQRPKDMTPTEAEAPTTHAVAEVSLQAEAKEASNVEVATSIQEASNPDVVETRVLEIVVPEPVHIGAMKLSFIVMETAAFELTNELVIQIYDHLNLPVSVPIMHMIHLPGARNMGLWKVTDGDRSLFLKLTSSQRLRPDIPTDAEQCIKLAQTCPGITTDDRLSFPTNILSLYGPTGVQVCDMLVMKEVPGMSLADHIGWKWHSKEQQQLEQLNSIVKSCGAFLYDIHSTYGMQHGDFHASNVHYDEATGVFSMIDVGDFDPNPFFYQGVHDDVTHFCHMLKTLEQHYDGPVVADCNSSFMAGYKERSGR
jgi:hypothetical protein